MGGVGGKHAEVASPWGRWLLRLVRHFWVGVWTQVLANCLDRNQPPKAAQGAMIARAATCDQIAPLPSVLSNEIAAPSANTTATAKPWARDDAWRAMPPRIHQSVQIRRHIQYYQL